MSLTNNPHPQAKKIFLSASYKTCCVFWDFNRVGSAYRIGKIPAQSHLRFGVFYLEIPKSGRTPSVKSVSSWSDYCINNGVHYICISIIIVKLNTTAIGIYYYIIY